MQAQNPSLYLLDEPESGVDLVSIEQVGMTIKGLLEEGVDCPGERCEKGKSALIITHTGQVLDYVTGRQRIYPLQWDSYVFGKSPENAGRNKEQRVRGVYKMQTDEVNLKKRAESAASKKAAFGEDFELDKFEKGSKVSKPIEDLQTLDEESKKTLLQVGVVAK